jgi:hypothetical protein
MNRRIQILVGILALQLILVAIVFWHRGGVGQAGQPLFPGVEVGQITKLTVHKEDGQPTEMDKGKAGWVLAGTDDFPVVSSTVTSALEQIVALTGDRAVATTAASQKRLKVTPDAYDRLVEFRLADGSQHRLYLGTSPSYGTTYVRADDQKEVYLASLKSSDLGTGPSTWIDTTYLTITQTQVTALTVQNKQGTFMLEKSGDAWTMQGLQAGETFDTSKATTILNSVSTLHMVQPLGKTVKPEYGLEQPLATLKVATTDKVVVLMVGAPSSDGNSYVVRSSESPYFVNVSKYSLSNLVDKGRDWFLVQPTPVPTLEPGATP